MAVPLKPQRIRGYIFQRRLRRSHRALPIEKLVVVIAAFASVQMFLFLCRSGASPESASDSAADRQLWTPDDRPFLLDKEKATTPCALIFYGLPRAFESLVLPSVRKNVLETNPACDVYVHFYNQTLDRPGRSGNGGPIDPGEVYLLDEHAGTVFYQGETEADFWEKRGDLLDKIMTAKDSKDRLLYFPWKEGTYNNGTIGNIIRMWHSVESAWLLMERESMRHNIQYKRVAMLRNDVVYLTPIYLDEFATDDTAVVPGFGRYPVSDRMVYGPYEAVRIWASERFQRMDEHARWILENDEGRALHSETFMNVTIFPAMRKVLGSSLGSIVEHPHLCFIRGRAGDYIPKRPTVTLQSIGAGIGSIMDRLEDVLGRRCNGWPYRIEQRGFKAVNCARRSSLFRWHAGSL